MTPSVRLLGLEDLEPFLAFGAAESAESGRDGDPYFGPYSRYELFPVDEVRKKTRKRWTLSSTRGIDSRRPIV